MTDDTRKPVSELSGRELDAEFRRVQSDVSASGSDVVGAAFWPTYVIRKTGIDLKRTPEENEAWAKRGAIKRGRAALKRDGYLTPVRFPGRVPTVRVPCRVAMELELRFPGQVTPGWHDDYLTVEGCWWQPYSMLRAWGWA